MFINRKLTKWIAYYIKYVLPALLAECIDYFL